MQIFFVGGTPKSGTTWVQRALDLHPEVTCSGEGHYHEYIIKPMFDMLVPYNNKKNFVKDIVYEGESYQPDLTQEIIRDSARSMIEYMLTQRALSSTRVVGDKTPGNVYVLRDLHIIFQDMLSIIVMRDPRDVAVSRLYHVYRSHDKEVLTRGSALRSEVVKASAKGWANAFVRSRNFSQDYSDRVLFVKYEEMSTNPVVVMQRMFNFLRVTSNAELIAHIVEASRFEAFSNRKPGVEDRASFYRKGTVGDWANELEPEAVRTITNVCAEGMQALGYAFKST